MVEHNANLRLKNIHLSFFTLGFMWTQLHVQTDVLMYKILYIKDS